MTARRFRAGPRRSRARSGKRGRGNVTHNDMAAADGGGREHNAGG